MRKRDKTDGQDPEYEYCTNCNANLTMQKGYSSDLPYWICKGCGMMLINPAIDTETDIAWFCDGCGQMLNVQKGFSDNLAEWKCLECGHVNGLSEEEVYSSDEEYQLTQNDPYKGLSYEQIDELMRYMTVEEIDGRSDIVLVRDSVDDRLYIKKYLSVYNRSIYEYLLSNPIEHMPRIKKIYESSNCLIVIENYIEGNTLAQLLASQGSLEPKKALAIAAAVCHILSALHGLPDPIIHRDVKPSNIIIKPDGEVFLLDVNAAKWFDPDKADDTRYMGTQVYAAPEQLGYGFKASSAKSDVYAVGVLLNVMLTGHFPKEIQAPAPFWPLIEKCISMDPEKRYTVEKLLDEIEKIGRILNES